LNILNTYLLTIRYVDTAGNELAPPFTGRYQAGASFGPIRSPRIAGYTPQYDAIVSAANGMPGTDLVVDVVYRQERQDSIQPQNPDKPNVQPQGPDTQPQNPSEPSVQPDVEPEEENMANSGGRAYERDVIAEVEVNDEGEAELIELEDEEIPLAPARAGYWALLNLIITIVVAILSIILWIAYLFKKKDDKEEEEEQDEKQVETIDEDEDEEEDEQKIKKKTWLRILSILVAIVTIIVFILTEDMTLTMTFVDKWTILMIVLLILQILIVFFSKKKKKDEEDEEEEENAEEPVAA